MTTKYITARVINNELSLSSADEFLIWEHPLGQGAERPVMWWNNCHIEWPDFRGNADGLAEFMHNPANVEEFRQKLKQLY